MARNKWRNEEKRHAEESAAVQPAAEATASAETPAEATAEAVPENNFATKAAELEAQGVETVAPVEPVKTAARGVLPDQFGNNVKGERICSVCGIKESETLAKNPRYSFCKGKCVNCYGKTERKTTKPSEMTVEQITAKIAYYTDLLNKKSGAQGLPEGSAAENTEASTVDAAAVASGASVVAEDNAETLAEVSE